MKTIMIVDDSCLIRVLLKKIFESHNFHVVAEASNGQEAIQKYMQFKPDLTTMDITMPVLDGISALEKIREMDANATVIMISALGQEMKIIEAVSKGAKHYIVKPFKEEDIMRNVETVLHAEEKGCINEYAV